MIFENLAHSYILAESTMVTDLSKNSLVKPGLFNLKPLFRHIKLPRIRKQEPQFLTSEKAQLFNAHSTHHTPFTNTRMIEIYGPTSHRDLFY